MIKRIFISLVLVSAGLFSKEQNFDPPLIQIGGGAFNVTKHKRSAMVQLEYKWRPVVAKLRPFVGLMATDKESLYAYGGIGYDIFIGNNFALTPSFAPGLYYRGKGKNLGYPLEFRSSIEAAAVFGGQHRIGAQFYHVSNASLGKKNPGAEALVFFLAIPLSSK
jgi:lipid A 3-O-deacylase